MKINNKKVKVTQRHNNRIHERKIVSKETEKRGSTYFKSKDRKMKE